jgi:hypothetical protein
MDETPTLRDPFDDPALCEADIKAVFACYAAGKKVDPEIAARIRIRSDRAREESFNRVGFVNIQDLLRPSVDEE